MKTLNILVAGVLALGTAYMIHMYMPDCAAKETHMRGIPGGQAQYQIIKTGKCYLIEE